MSTVPHPELALIFAAHHGSDAAAIEDLNVEPCSPGCGMVMAQRLWPAWRQLSHWRDRVDAELPGEMTRLMPELWRMWRGLDNGYTDDGEPATANGGAPLGTPVDEALDNEAMRLLLEDLCRAVFALGAGWAQNRGTAG